MLDVHPAHHAANTWRDFFIHIATIVLGLLIAVGLEQTVEYLHRNHLRHQLREDLRAEAGQRIERLRANVAIETNDINWFRAVLDAGRQAPVSKGLVTLVLPPKTRMPYIADAVNGVWTAARASASVAVLTREEIELWDTIDNSRALGEGQFSAREEAEKVLHTISERLGLRLAPGQTLRLAPEDRDELMRAYARLLEDTWQLRRDSAYWEGACDGALQGATTEKDLLPYETRAVASLGP